MSCLPVCILAKQAKRITAHVVGLANLTSRLKVITTILSQSLDGVEPCGSGVE